MKCSKCGSIEVHYVQRVTEYYSVTTLTDGQVELGDLQDVYVDQDTSPYLLCDSCESKFSMKMDIL